MGDIVGSIASIPDRIKRSVFIRECSSNLGVSEEILYGEIGKILRRKNDQINKRPYGESEVAAPRARHKSQINIGADEDGQFEEEIIRLLVKYGNIKFYDLKDKKGNPIIINVAQVLIKEMNSEKDLLQFRKPDMKEIYEIVEKQVNSSGTVNTQMLVNHPDQSISTYIAGLLSKEYNLSQYWKKKDNYIETEEQKLEELVPETIFALKHYRIKTLLKQSEEKLKEKLTDDELMKTLGIIRNLQKINQSLSKKLGDRTIV